MPRLPRTERDPLWRREMRERWRRPVTLFFLALYALGLCWIAYSLYASLVPTGTVEQGANASGIGHRLFTVLLGAQIGGWIPCALLLAAPTIAVERERGAFVEYLLAGLEPRQIARAKFASIATFIIVMCAIPLPVLALCFPLGGVEPMELVAGVLLEIAVALTCAAVGLLVSSNQGRVARAMQNALVMAIVFLLGAGMLLPGLLEAPFGVWLMMAAFLAVVTGLTFASCEQALEHMGRHLEHHERALEPPRLPVPVAPPPPPRPQQVASTKVFEPPVERMTQSSFDERIENLAGWNAITQREVRVGMRASKARMGMLSDEHVEPVSYWGWLALGVVGAFVVLLPGASIWWRMGLGLISCGALCAAALDSSGAFTREREQKMLEQLRLCSLSPFQLVTGKVAATGLLVLRTWGGPLFCLVVVGLSQGVPVLLTSALFVGLCLLLSICVGTTLSLLCRHTAISAGGTLGFLVVALFLLPLAPIGLSYFVPALRPVFASPILGGMWIEPLRVVLGFAGSPLALDSAFLRLDLSLLVLNALLIAFATRVLSRARLDESQSQTRFWERDLSRSWR